MAVLLVSEERLTLEKTTDGGEVVEGRWFEGGKMRDTGDISTKVQCQRKQRCYSAEAEGIVPVEALASWRGMNEAHKAKVRSEGSLVSQPIEKESKNLPGMRPFPPRSPRLLRVI